MPGFNGRGPAGEGPRTGRGQGRCTGKDTPNPTPQGRGRRQQDGSTSGGFGFRRWLRRGNNQWRGNQNGN